MKLMLFTTDYCEPCKAFKPIFSNESTKYHGVDFSLVNATEEREMARMYRVRTVPTLVLTSDSGEQLGEKIHPYNEDDIYHLIMEV